MMQRITLAAVLALLFAFWGAQPDALASKTPETPEALYDAAVKNLSRGYYEKAVATFEQIKVQYPFSQYAVLSELRLGDAHFQKGEYLEAIDSYRTFLKLHPKHPEIDYVTYRIGLSQFKDAPKWAQRDQTATRQMLATTQRFEERFPQSIYLEEVSEMRAEGRERLAKGVFGIGQFYWRRGRFEHSIEARDEAFHAASRRFEEVLDTYPDIEDVCADALLHVGFMLATEGRLEDARQTVSRLKERFPENARSALVLERRIARQEKRLPREKPGEKPPARSSEQPQDSQPEDSFQPTLAPGQGNPESDGGLDGTPAASPEAPVLDPEPEQGLEPEGTPTPGEDPFVPTLP